MTRTKRVHLELNVGNGAGDDYRSYTYEVTRTPLDDEEPLPLGTSQLPDEDYGYTAELISGDVEDANDDALDDAEQEAIDMAKREWRAA